MGSGKKPHEKIYWLIFLASFLAAALFIFFQNESFYRDYIKIFSPPSSETPQLKPVRLTIDFNNGEKRAFEGRAASGMTIVSALRVAQNVGRFAVAIDKGGRITDIAGVKNNAGKNWDIYVNKALISDLPGHIEIKPGDGIVFKYE